MLTQHLQGFLMVLLISGRLSDRTTRTTNTPLLSSKTTLSPGFAPNDLRTANGKVIRPPLVILACSFMNPYFSTRAFLGRPGFWLSPNKILLFDYSAKAGLSGSEVH